MSTTRDLEPLVERPYARRWLERDLSALVERGVVPEEIAARIRAAYAVAGADGLPRWGTAVLAVLGAALIGGGLILLLAHNWPALSRATRAAVAVGPLLVSCAVGGWTLRSGRGAAWREGIGAFQPLTTLLALALVGQTYHLGGTFDDLLRTWTLLTLPLVVVLDAITPALMYLASLLAWTGSLPGHSHVRLAAIGGVLLLLVPYLGWLRRAGGAPARARLLMWAMGIALPIAYGFALTPYHGAVSDWPLWTTTVFVTMALVGARWTPTSRGWGAAPWRVIGMLGTVVVALLGSFRDVWTASGHGWTRGDWPAAVLLAAPIGLATALTLEAARRRDWSRATPAIVLLTAIVARAISGRRDGWLPALLFTLALAVVGLQRLAQGLRERRLGTVNAGMAVLAAVILARFFDTDLPYLWRGVAFLAAGVAILAVNRMWSRRAVRREAGP